MHLAGACKVSIRLILLLLLLYVEQQTLMDPYKEVITHQSKSVHAVHSNMTHERKYVSLSSGSVCLKLIKNVMTGCKISFTERQVDHCSI